MTRCCVGLLGTLVKPVTFRAPGILAKTVATLDVLSGGRSFCGIGAGWWAREHAGFGPAISVGQARFDELESAIETLRALGSPAPGSTAASGSGCPEPPAARGRCRGSRSSSAASGEKRTLAIAARLGDGGNLPSDVSILDRKLAIFRQHCLQAGRDPAQAEVTVLDIPVIGRYREDAASIVEKLRGRTTAAAFAQRHHAGEPIGRYRLLADRGVKPCSSPSPT